MSKTELKVLGDPRKAVTGPEKTPLPADISRLEQPTSEPRARIREQPTARLDGPVQPIVEDHARQEPEVIVEYEYFISYWWRMRNGVSDHHGSVVMRLDDDYWKDADGNKALLEERIRAQLIAKDQHREGCIISIECPRPNDYNPLRTPIEQD